MKYLIAFILPFFCFAQIPNVHFENQVFHWVAKGQLEKIQSYYERQAFPLNIVNEKGNSLLHVASKKGHIPIMEFLIENGLSVNILNKQSQTPLSFSILHFVDLKIKEFLISQRASLEKSKPLFVAFQVSDLETIKLLIDNKAPLNQKDYLGQSPIHLVFSLNHNLPSFYLLKLLIKNGADINSKDLMGLTPLDLALKEEFYYKFKQEAVTMIHFLMDHGAGLRLTKGLQNTYLSDHKFLELLQRRLSKNPKLFKQIQQETKMRRMFFKLGR